jgi:hypothetical protein
MQAYLKTKISTIDAAAEAPDLGASKTAASAAA